MDRLTPEVTRLALVLLHVAVASRTLEARRRARLARLVEASGGDFEHARRVEAVLDGIGAVP